MALVALLCRVKLMEDVQAIPLQRDDTPLCKHFSKRGRRVVLTACAKNYDLKRAILLGSRTIISLI